MIGWDNIGFTRIGGSANNFFIIVKVCLHFLFQLKAYVFLNNLIIGFVLSANTGKNLDKTVKFLTNLWTSYKFFGLFLETSLLLHRKYTFLDLTSYHTSLLL